MNKQTTTQETTNCFSAAAMREAMGPGYQAALFRDQPALTGCQPSFARPVPLPRPTWPNRATPRPQRTNRFRSWANQLRLPRVAAAVGRLVGLRLA